MLIRAMSICRPLDGPMLWGSIFTGMPRRDWRAFAICWMLAWHLVLVHHNLAFWLQVPEEARQICAPICAHCFVE